MSSKIKVYNLTLFKRLLAYIKSYRNIFITSIISVFCLSIFGALRPVVLEKIVDENGNDISEWKPMSGVSDLTRVKKQQAIIISLMKGIREFESLNSFFKFVNALENAFVIDRNISVIQASELVWSFRNIDYDNINKLTVPTYNYTTEAGAQVLILDENFYEFLVSKGLIE